MSEAGGVNEYVYTPAEVSFSVAVTKVHVLALQRLSVTVGDSKTTDVPSAYKTLMAPLNRLGAAKAGTPLVPKIGNPTLASPVLAYTDPTPNARKTASIRPNAQARFMHDQHRLV